ncbi:FGGY family carbohydrate kinase [Microlunatus speluncae]|uniref:FGGY family carbohydrate kinase n=1 Tax=Microlunatus speluncae TaxID=2594267 RepID=UPI0013757D25|nr:FGGY family carbohydrate kinase [Microlunatus speluncae]
MATAEPVIMAIDQGTTNSKAVAVTAAGAVVGRGSAAVPIRNPAPGLVEQDADELWQSVLVAIEVCRAEQSGPVRALAISNQRESVVVWDRDTGRPLGPVISWQDTRTADDCARLIASPGADVLVRQRTGLRIDPMFSAPKLAALLRSATDPVRAIAVGTVDSWLIWRLTGGHDHLGEAGNASRTLLYDVAALGWSAELLDLFGIPAERLPTVITSDATIPTGIDLPGIDGRPPIAAVLADSHAALYGQGGTTAGTAKATYGTGSSVMMPVPRFSPDPSPVPTTLAWLTDRPTYAREGNIVFSGASLAWLTRLLGLPSVADLLTLAASVPDSAGVSFVPAFGGLGAPHWQRDAEPTFTGLTAATTREQLARAGVDAVAHQVADVVEVIIEEGTAIKELRVDGGVTASALVMQTQADLLGIGVRVAGVAELSAVGAARMAWAGLGAEAQWPTADPAAREFVPSITADERKTRRAHWRRALPRP